MNERICEYCAEPITGVFVWTGTGPAHAHCYAQRNPPAPAANFYVVARGHVDPVLAAEVMADLVPEPVKTQVIEEYNKRLLAAHLRRCQPL
jgi:hypothetical protein